MIMTITPIAMDVITSDAVAAAAVPIGVGDGVGAA